MNAKLKIKSTFESAHSLPHLPEGHKCRRVHGHNWVLWVTIGGEIDAEDGMVVDYMIVENIIDRQVVEVLDHQTLNDIEGLNNPTSELVAKWIWERIAKSLFAQPYGKLTTLVVSLAENERSECIYEYDVQQWFGEQWDKEVMAGK